MVDRFSLRVSADSYLGDPQFIIRMDGTQFRDVLSTSAPHAAGQSQTFSFTGNFSSVHQISVQLINDRYDGNSSMDRNLYVESLTFNGQTQLGNQAVYLLDGSFGSAAVVGHNPSPAVYNVNGWTDPSPLPNINAAFRFFDTATGDHFYTLSATEKNQIQATLPTYKFEGVGWATPEQGAGTIDVFRFFDTTTKQHFFTASAAERDQILTTLPTYQYEGVAFEAYASAATAGPGAVTLERFFNTNTGLHHYAANADEAYAINHGSAGAGWIDEGKAFTVHVPTGEILSL